MGFESFLGLGPKSEKDLEKKKADLLLEISYLGVKLEEIQKLLQEATKTKVDIEFLRAEFSDINGKVIEIRKDVSLLEDQKVGLLAGNKILSDALIKKDEVEKSVSELTSKLSLLNDSIKVAEDRKQAAEIATEKARGEAKYILDTANNEADTLKKENQIQKTEMAAEKKKHQDEISALVELKNTHYNSTLSLKKETEEATIKRDALFGEVDLAQRKLNQLDSEFVLRKETQDKELVSREEKVALKEKAIEDRESAVNFKEMALEGKISNLRMIKEQLEKQAGKQINLIF